MRIFSAIQFTKHFFFSAHSQKKRNGGPDQWPGGGWGAEQDVGGVCRAAHHSGETTTRGNLIRRPRHDAPHTPAFPTQNSRVGALSGWARSDPNQGPSIKVGRADRECGSVNDTVGGIQKAAARLAMTARGSVGSSHCAHGTRPHIFERHQPTDTVVTIRYKGCSRGPILGT